MKNFLCSALLLLISFGIGYSGVIYLSGKYELAAVFTAGVLVGIFLMSLTLNVKNTKIDIYKRELEKESVTSDKNSARVKVLESKIEVLEKALENALKK